MHRDPVTEMTLHRAHTHALLDALTIYGTQRLRPFTAHPFGVGSLFVADPLSTLPLPAGLTMALRRSGDRGLRRNRAGLLLGNASLV